MDALSEHSYAKPLEGGSSEETAMDSSTPVANADDIIVNVTQLDKTQDTYESLLVELLKSHSQQTSGQQQLLPEETLSIDQLDRICSSTVTNYESVRHLLKTKQKYTGSDRIDSVGVVSEIPDHSPSHNGPSDHTSLNNSSGSTISDVPSNNSFSSTETTGSSKTTATLGLPSPGAKSPSFSIKISPDQLKTIQSQIADMFKQQSLQLPEGLTPEQKQLVLNSLIAQQLNATLQQLIPGGTPTTTTTTANALSNTPSCNSNHEGRAVDSAQSLSRPSGIHGNKSVVQSVPSTGNALVNSSSSSNLTLNDVSNKASEQKVEESGKKKKDPDSKRPPTAFNLFFREMYPIVQTQQPNISFSDASKMVSGLWSGLGQDGKKKYYDTCEQKKNEFNSRVKEATPTTEDHPPVANSVGKLDQVKPPLAGRSTGKKSGKKREKEKGMCQLDGCYNAAVPDQQRGNRYCSNQCVVNHSKIIFHSWVSQRKLKT